jgi:rfaE bifunctional protein kinase chain/domain
MVSASRLLEIIDGLDRVRVVLYGDLVLDRFVLGTPKRISREAPVIILRHEAQRDIPGGGANALANLASLGVAVVAVGAVGRDEPGDALLAALAERNVDTARVLRVEGFRTPTKVRILGGGPSSLKHQVARYDIEDCLTPAAGWAREMSELLRTEVATADALAVSDYGYGTVLPATLATLRDSIASDTWMCLDSRHRVAEMVGVHAATPNLQELEAQAGARLSSDAEVAAAAEALRRRLDARFVLATRGNRGMSLVATAAEPLHIPVYGTDEVADVTGAGDTVLAVLTAALAAGASPAEAATLANYAGGIVVMKLGTATVSRDELRRAVERDLGGRQG